MFLFSSICHRWNWKLCGVLLGHAQLWESSITLHSSWKVKPVIALTHFLSTIYHYYHCYATCLSWWPRKLATMLQNTSHLIFLFSDFLHSLVFTSRELRINFQFSSLHFYQNCVFFFTFSHSLPNLPIFPKSQVRAPHTFLTPRVTVRCLYKEP